MLMKHHLDNERSKADDTMAALVEDKTQAEKMASFGFSAVDIGAAAATVDAADGATESAEIEEYISFLSKLYDRIVEDGAYRPLDRIASVHAAEPHRGSATRGAPPRAGSLAHTRDSS